MSMTFAEMIAAAAASGSGPMENPPAGTHNGIIVSANAKRSSGGKVCVGLLIKVEGGANNGSGCWSNQYLSPESATALGIWFRTFEALGIPTAWWAQFSDMDQAAAQAAELVKGKQCQFQVEYREWKGEMQADVKSIRKAVAGGAAPAAAIAPLTAPAPLAPAAPLPAAPVAVAAPVAPEAAPVAPPAAFAAPATPAPSAPF